MADHIWSVLCNRGILDKYTNNVSLIDVTEEIQLQPAEEITPGKRNAVRLSLFLVSLWKRSDYSVPEKTLARVSFTLPDGETLPVTEIAVDLESHRRTRTFVGIAGLPVKGPGPDAYEFHVDLLTNGEWCRVATLPLDVTVLPFVADPPAQPQTAPLA